MAILKNKIVAIIVAALVVVLSTGVSAVGGLENLYEEQIEAVFEDQLLTKLNNCVSAANGVSSTLVTYPAYQTQLTALNSARNGIIESNTIEDKILYYVNLKSAMDDIKATVADDEFTEREETMLSGYFTSYDTAVLDIIRSSGTYNNSVDSFNNTISSFPASFFIGFTDISTPDKL